jgi:hypothetical protein
MLVRILICSILIVASFAKISAQQNQGTLKGTVTDQLGSLVVGAEVSIRTPRGVTLKVTTNAGGVYEFRRLEPGNYEIKVSAPGFTPYEEKSVALPSHQTLTLDVQLTVSLEAQQVTVDTTGVSTDSDNNASAIVLRGRELEALPNDPQALAAALQAMAGPPDMEGGAQVKVDGFSNGQMPPKEAIREVRINQNPFSAENEFPGFNGIEIFTQPGSDKWHGSFSFDFNDESLNSRNPFTTRKAPYQQRSINANLSGPVVAKRASFSAYFGRTVSDSNSIVNATILDPISLQPVAVNQSLVTPQTSTFGNGRLDLKLNKKHTLVGRVNYWKSTQDLQGIGGFSLPTRAYRGDRSDFNLQITETALINEKTVNETRLQIIRSRFKQTSVTNLPALNVLDSFFGGGSQVGSSSNKQDRFELQNFTSWSIGNHFLKVGARLRHVGVDSISPSNFGGTYTFAGGLGPQLDANNQIVTGPNGQPVLIDVSSLERYRRTLAGMRNGLSPTAIRLLGGGATQFSIAGGEPEADVKQADVSFYFQDEWKVTPHFTLSPGLRYENQNNIDSHFNFAPRIAFAWSPVFGSKKSPTAAPETKNATTSTTAAATPAPAPSRPSGTPKTVFRGGFGIFYNRVSEDVTLQATRYNGINQQQFLTNDPTVLDLFPLIPPVSLLEAFSQPQVTRVVADDLTTSRSLRLLLTVERQLPRKIKLSFTYSHAHTNHVQRVVNINAPLGGTYIPGQPNSGVRPLGQSAGNVLQYQPTGHAVGNSLNINLNGTVKKINFWGGYSLGKSRNTDSGQTGAPFDAYDFSQEFARSQFSSLSFAYGGGNYQGPYGLNLNLFLIANSGQPFNITTGRDTNGDTFFSERPAFATDPNDPGVVVTPLGAFDPTPSPGQQIIPRNFGRAPGFVSVNLGFEKIFKFGKAIEPPAPPAGAAKTTEATSPQKPPAKAPVQRPYTLSFSMYASNLFNRTNKGTTVGNMASPYFLQSASGSNSFIFGPGGGSGGNRLISLRIRLSF